MENSVFTQVQNSSLWNDSVNNLQVQSFAKNDQVSSEVSKTSWQTQVQAAVTPVVSQTTLNTVVPITPQNEQVQISDVIALQTKQEAINSVVSQEGAVASSAPQNGQIQAVNDVVQPGVFWWAVQPAPIAQPVSAQQVVQDSMSSPVSQTPVQSVSAEVAQAWTQPLQPLVITPEFLIACYPGLSADIINWIVRNVNANTEFAWLIQDMSKNPNIRKVCNEMFVNFVFDNKSCSNLELMMEVPNIQKFLEKLIDVCRSDVFVYSAVKEYVKTRVEPKKHRAIDAFEIKDFKPDTFRLVIKAFAGKASIIERLQLLLKNKKLTIMCLKK